VKIFLVGFMGSGKSLIGSSLSQKLQTEFFDLDKEIEKKFGHTISHFFKIHGELEFRKEEASLLREIANQHKSFVMATGGGTPCFHNNMKWMIETGNTIYLKVSVNSLIDRLKKDKAGRPLLSSLTDKNLEVFIEDLFKEREKYYMQSAMEVIPENFSTDNLLENIAELLNNK
jgi:shikimate kinase